MKFTRMTEDGLAVEQFVDPTELVGTARGPKAAAQARPDELVWLVSGEYAGQKMVLDYKQFMENWTKPEWKVDSRSLGVDRYHKLTLDKRAQVKELVEHLRYAEKVSFGCICPNSCAIISIGWDDRTVIVRPGPGFPKTAAKLVAIIGMMDWGVEAAISRRSWKPRASDAVLKDVKLYAEWDWEFVELTCADRQECWKIAREIRTEIRPYVGDVKVVQLGPPPITDWKLGAPQQGLDVAELLRSQEYTTVADAHTVTGGWKPEWLPEMAKEVLGEPCMIQGDRAWNQATCQSDMRSAPTYHCVGGVWKLVVAPANDEVREPRPDPMIALRKLVRQGEKE